MVLPDFSNPAIAAFYAIYFGMLFLAALIGALPERLGAVPFVLLIFGQSVLYTVTQAQQFLSVDLGLLILDMITVATLFALARHANRIWPARAAGMLFLSVLSHIARLLMPGLEELSYVQFNALPTLLAAAILLAGSVTYRVRRFRGHNDAHWFPYKEYEVIREVFSGENELSDELRERIRNVIR